MGIFNLLANFPGLLKFHVHNNDNDNDRDNNNNNNNNNNLIGMEA